MAAGVVVVVAGADAAGAEVELYELAPALYGLVVIVADVPKYEFVMLPDPPLAPAAAGAPVALVPR